MMFNPIPVLGDLFEKHTGILLVATVLIIIAWSSYRYLKKR
jgi:hypothetical protein